MSMISCSFPARLVRGLSDLRILTLLVTSALLQIPVIAANYVITSTTPSPIDFAGHVWSAGDEIIIESHTRTSELILQNIVGSAAHPIVIRNKTESEGTGGGQFVINNSTTDKGLWIMGSQYFVLKGMPGSTYDYGISIKNKKSAGQGIGLSVMKHWTTGVPSSDYEITGIEVSDTGSIGILAKNIGITGSSGVWLENVRIHDNYVHDTGTEGIYVGASNWHLNDEQNLRNILIYNNRVENTGWDGIQLSCAISGSSIYNNRIVYYGILTTDDGQDEGIRSNPGTAADIYNNIIIGSSTDSGEGIFANPYNSVKYYNNLIVTPRQNGIRIDETAEAKGYVNHYSVKLINNTIVKPGLAGIMFADSTPAHSTGNAMINNIIAEPQKKTEAGALVYTDIQPGWTVPISGQLHAATIDAVGFINAAAGTYRLAPTSPAVNTGDNTSGDGVTFDLDGIARPQASAYDKGAYEYGTVFTAGAIASDASIFPQVNTGNLYTHKININASSATTVNGVAFDFGTGNGGGAQPAKNYTFSRFNNAITNFNSTASGDIHTVLATRATNTSSASYTITLTGLTVGDRHTFALLTDSAHAAGRGWYRLSEDIDTVTADFDFSAGGVNASRVTTLSYTPTSTSVTITLTRLDGVGTTSSSSWIGFAGFVNYQ